MSLLSDFANWLERKVCKGETEGIEFKSVDVEYKKVYGPKRVTVEMVPCEKCGDIAAVGHCRCARNICHGDTHYGLSYCSEDCGCGGGQNIYCVCCDLSVRPEDPEWEKWFDIWEGSCPSPSSAASADEPQ